MKKLHANPILFSVIRVALFAMILAGIWYLMVLDSVTLRNDGKFGEQSYTEILQEVFLTLSALVFIFIARADARVRGFAIGLCSFCVAMLVREFNNYFHTLFIGAWQLVMISIAIPSAIILYRNRDTILKPVRKFTQTPAFGVFLSGFLIVMIFSRLYGLHDIWYNILGDSQAAEHRWVKNASEEGIELLGYALLFFGTLEYFVQRQKKWLTKPVHPIHNAGIEPD